MNYQGNPFRQGVKGEKLTPFRCKLIPQNEENGNFSKTSYMSGGYLEATRYLKSQPLESRKNGFGSKDAYKTDEFSNAIRTQQYRESIEKELLIQQGVAGKNEERLKQLLAERKGFDAPIPEGARNYAESVPQFDIGRSRVTEFDPKSIKDTYYKFDNDHGKRLGMYRPVSCEVGLSAWNMKYQPPSHGGKSEVSKFFDKSHLSIQPL